MQIRESYWQRDAGWRDGWAGAAIRNRVDFAVLGGGLAGLMTAIRLREREPGAEIALLEAERVGYGASGRNAGFLSPLAAPIWLLGAERSAEQAWAAARVNAEVHAIAGWLAAHVPGCELRPARLGLAAGGRLADGSLREFARAAERVGLAHGLVESRARPGHLCLEMAAYTVHPYQLVRGLAEHAARAGVRIHERARVRAVEEAAAGARVRLEDGRAIQAGKVIVCTNAYTGAIDVGERVRALVVHSFMAATAPIEGAAAGTIVRDGDFTVEVNAAQAYHRMHGGRIIYGGIDKIRAPAGGDFAVPAGVRSGLARHMRASFPGVDEIAIAEAWSGRFHATATGLPILRPSAASPAVILNVGYGGTGVALALACAPLAAAVAAGGAFASDGDARLLSVIRETRISVRDSVRALARVVGGLARPWRAA